VRTSPVAAAAPPASTDPDAAGDPPKWTVDEPGGPTKTVALDVTEGTWMGLDVSPDGKTVVFDLLGDLYTLPIAGGDATPLTSGIAWDMQPRFSPDGQFVAFTSDRGGGDNVWLVPVAGDAAAAGPATPRAVTTEDFRLVNSPAWSPDGDYIAVRKHFVAERSLGAGELWLVHTHGGGGVQVTKRANDQKDLGEPAFSPDGKYLYFSRDASPGKVFDYNKDPHAGIYEIQRIDRSDGTIETVVAGPGGAVRPTPSPDGRTLAFVRREGLKTVLAVRDLSSGRTRTVWDGLDRDMQETWAIHGVYPGFDWTPDGKAIVIWAQGQLHRVDVASGRTAPIPFRVRHERRVSEPLRFAQTVHPPEFHTKLLRWVEVSPDGRSVVFQALDKLWLRSLPDGKVRRLTKGPDAGGSSELYPAFSRDGRSVVFTTWDDEALGTVAIADVASGRVRTISREPGHYVTPAFSPDGRYVVASKITGGYVRTDEWSGDPGLYRFEVAGGDRSPPLRLRKRGSQPHFGSDPARVFVVDVEAGDDGSTRVLRSIGLDGREEREHARIKDAAELRVAPDGRFLAFRELWNVYVTPFPAAGRPVELSRDSKALPVRKVSRDAGVNLRWSGDASTLHWSLGPELFSRSLRDTYPFVAGAPDPLPEPSAQGVDIGFDVPSHVPDETWALQGATIVTMKGDEVIRDGVVVVERNRITAVGARGSVAVPSGAQVIDVSGKTIIPGIVDVHAHGAQGSDGIIPEHNWLHYATLAFGVTTVHDPSNDTDTIFAAAELARAGKRVAPRTFSTGTILYGALTPFAAKVESLEDARGHLRRMKAVGAFSVKSYNQPRRDQRQQIVAAARELEMMVVPEGGSLFQHNMTMVVDGHTGVEHAIPVARAYADVQQLWGATPVGYTPTIVVGYGGLWGENYWYQESDVFANARLRRFVPPFAYEPVTRRRVKASDGDWNHIDIARACERLTAAGVKVNLGAHGQREGLAAHWELWSLVQGGMSPLEALRAATWNGAWYLGLEREIGSIEPGKLADLAVIDGDPLSDIRSTERVALVMVNGRLFDAATMTERGGDKAAPPRFFWERAGAASRAEPPPGATCNHGTAAH
jgi:imidazolonepropionase-like amidohydrolase/Tol biopolymer transport system component